MIKTFFYFKLINIFDLYLIKHLPLTIKNKIKSTKFTFHYKNDLSMIGYNFSTTRDFILFYFSLSWLLLYDFHLF